VGRDYPTNDDQRLVSAARREAFGKHGGSGREVLALSDVPLTKPGVHHGSWAKSKVRPPLLFRRVPRGNPPC
jgi:hypothetical protein